MAETRWAVVKRAFVAIVFLVSLATLNAPVAIHGVNFFAAFRARECFSLSERERVGGYFDEPHWIVNRDLVRFRVHGAPFPPLEIIRPDLTEQEYAAKQGMLRKIPLGNYYLLAR